MLRRFRPVFLVLLLSLARLLASAELPDGLYARIETARGVMIAELDYRQAPLTVCNFVGLAKGLLGPKPGIPYFDGLSFHRVVPGFVIQGGDPLGTGEGGPGYEFPDEFSARLRHDRPFVLSMANGGPDTNGSQFFITLDDTTRLNYLHSVFGSLVSGKDVPARIQKSDTMKVSILRRGPAAAAFRCDRAAFDALRARASLFNGNPEPGPGSAFSDPDGLLPSDVPRARNFNIKLLNFLRTHRVPLVVQLLATTPASLRGTGAEASASLRQLAAEHGVRDRGAFALYLHDSSTWLLCAPTLSTQAQERLRASAQDRAVRNLAQARALQAPGLVLPPALQLKLQVDAFLDELCFALTP